MLVLDVARYCVAQNTLHGWESFMERHEEMFRRTHHDASELKFEFSEIHDQFIQMVEQDLKKFLQQNNCSVSDFYNECKQITTREEDGKDELVATFVDVITMATSFLVFVDVMKSPEKRKYLFPDS